VESGETAKSTLQDSSTLRRSSRKLIYVAGPLTTGHLIQNVRRAAEVGERIKNAGYLAYVPHTLFAWELCYPRDYEHWLAYDFEWVAFSDAIVRLEGASPGADREIEHARMLGIPVIYCNGKDDYLDILNLLFHK